METNREPMLRAGARGFTPLQYAVLRVLNPAEGFALDHYAVADAVGATPRGALYVLYHLADADLVAVDEFGYYLTRRGESLRADTSAGRS